MENETALREVKRPETGATMSVRELTHRLLDCTDQDAECYFTFRNSDPIPVTDFEENEDGQIIFYTS